MNEVNLSFFTAPGPQLVGDEYGREPSLLEIIRHYYWCHGCTNVESITEEYIDELIRRSRK